MTLPELDKVYSAYDKHALRVSKNNWYDIIIKHQLPFLEIKQLYDSFVHTGFKTSEMMIHIKFCIKVMLFVKFTYIDDNIRERVVKMW